jgi:hypothetical protein
VRGGGVALHPGDVGAAGFVGELAAFGEHAGLRVDGDDLADEAGQRQGDGAARSPSEL